MKRNFMAFFAALLICAALARGASATDGLSPARSVPTITVATSDNRPLSIDRLMYTAFKEINYLAVVKSSSSLQLSYELTDGGERGGVISSTPGLQNTYKNLRKVPVELESNYLNVYTLQRGKNYDGWDGLSGLKVGMLTQRVYIRDNLPDSTEIFVKDTSSLLLEGLIAGEYDVIVMSRRGNESLSLPEGVFFAGTLETLSEYLYLHKSYEYLVPAITQSLETLFSDGRAEKILSDIPLSEPGTKKTVLHIISFNTELVREDYFSARLREGFSDDDSIEWYTIALNSRRFSSDSNRIMTIAQLLRQDFASREVAAVVVSGESALRFIEEYYLLFFRNVPVVFYGMDNSFFDETSSFEKQYTGIIEKPSVYETAELALELFPKTRNFFIINDYTYEGLDYAQAAKEQLSPFESGVNIEYSQDTGRDELLAKIRGLPEDTIILAGSYFRDSNGQYYPQNDMRRALEANSSVPIFTYYSIDSGYGAIGGKCPDYSLYGDQVASQLRNVLDGVPVSEIPIITESQSYNRWVFDKNNLDHWNLSLEYLPSDATIFNETLSVWETDPMLAYALVAIVVLCIFISVGLTVFLNAYNKQKTHLLSARELLVRDEKLREVKERLERIINTAPLAFMQSINGIAVETNEYVQKHIGIKTGDKLLPYYTDPIKRAGLLVQAETQSFVENTVVQFHMPGGTTHRFLTNISAHEYEGEHGYFLWAMDVEELERRKDELQLARENLQTMLDILPMPIMIYTPDDGLIVYVNRAAKSLFGAGESDELCGMSILEFLAPVQPDGTDTAQLLDSFVFEKSASVELVCRKLGGENFDCLVTACLIEYRGRLSSLGMLTDLTAEKEYAQMLRNTAEKEKEANMLKSRFLVNMSHEIRTPMNAIIGLTEIELRKSPSKETRDIYTKINTSAKNLLNIINDILDLSKIEADKIELFEDEFELEEVVASALLVATPRLDDKDVELMLNESLELPRFLVGDRTRLWQILKNFLDNAAKYTESGKIVLTITEDKTRRTSEVIYMSFSIEDTGIGMSDEQLSKLFVPYVQIYNDAQKRYTGSGLGMAISKRLCQIMGGTLYVKSAPDSGTGVYFTLPFKLSVKNETELNAIKSAILRNVRVLAVDDDDVSLSIMKSLFEANGAICDVASGGEQALEMVFRSRDIGKAYDLILLDYMLGGISGLETARRINSGLSNAPRLLMVTAYQRLLVAHDLYESGINDVIEKPFIPSVFIKKVSEAISGSGGEQTDLNELPQFTGVRVLLCEDYFLNQEVAIGIFEQFGVSTTVAENGKEGLIKLESGESFDLIFMDLQMPVMDGYTAAKAIRADSRFDNIPIISLTADAMKEVADKCIEHGMNDHIAKPIEPEHVGKIFLKWLPESKRVKKVGQIKPMRVRGAREEAVLRFGGNRARYERALHDFAAALPETWDDFEIAAQDSGLLRREVHKIKGAAGNLSENDLFQSADLLESSLRAGNPDRGFYERFIAACRALKDRVLLSDSKNENTASSAAVWSKEELYECLDRLEDALKNYDPRRTAKAVEELCSRPFPAGAETLNELCILASGYEFESALEVLYCLKRETI